MAKANPRGGPGAPTKLDESLIKKIENLLRCGTYVETAAAACGVNKTTLYRWLKRGAKARQGLCTELCNAVDRAMAEAEIRDLAVIGQAAQGTKFAQYLTDPAGNKLYDRDGLPRLILPLRPDWRAALSRLERRNPKRWGPRQTLEHKGLDAASQGPQIVLTMPSNGREARAEKKQSDEK